MEVWAVSGLRPKVSGVECRIYGRPSIGAKSLGFGPRGLVCRV